VSVVFGVASTFIESPAHPSGQFFELGRAIFAFLLFFLDTQTPPSTQSGEVGGPLDSQVLVREEFLPLFPVSSVAPQNLIDKVGEEDWSVYFAV
jgi:hypothetical protein